MDKLLFSLSIVTLIFVTGCAKSPESISASYISPLVYTDLSCSQMGAELSRVDVALTQASVQQRNARSNDTVGVLLLGLPVSTLSGGNVADQVARLKGEKQTLEQSAIRRDCGIEFVEILSPQKDKAEELNNIRPAAGNP